MTLELKRAEATADPLTIECHLPDGEETPDPLVQQVLQNKARLQGQINTADVRHADKLRELKDVQCSLGGD